MARRQFLAQLLGLPFLSLGAKAAEEPKTNAVVPVGWPPLSEAFEKIMAKHIPVFA